MTIKKRWARRSDLLRTAQTSGAFVQGFVDGLAGGRADENLLVARCAAARRALSGVCLPCARGRLQGLHQLRGGGDGGDGAGLIDRQVFDVLGS